eukprot:scaffold25772_cov136-Isochrysis_galbana.AAC.7
MRLARRPRPRDAHQRGRAHGAAHHRPPAGQAQARVRASSRRATAESHREMSAGPEGISASHQQSAWAVTVQQSCGSNVRLRHRPRSPSLFRKKILRMTAPLARPRQCYRPLASSARVWTWAFAWC